MKGKKCSRFGKLSEHIPSASLLQTQGSLEKLRYLSRCGSEIGDDISHIIEDMQKVAAPNQEPFVFTTALSDNRALLQGIFSSCSDIRFRDLRAGSVDAFIIYISGLVDTKILDHLVIKPLMETNGQQAGSMDIREIARTLLPVANVSAGSKPSAIIKEVMSGSALLFLDMSAECLVITIPDYVKRAVSLGNLEGVLTGPKDTFNETLDDNIVLIRRRARDPNIKVELFEIGERTQTPVALIYCSALVKPGLVEELKRRLGAIKTDHLLLSSTIEEFLVDHPWSPFPQALGTESPTKVTSSLYEGKAAILVDGAPLALIFPCTFTMLIQATEDYATSPIAASLLRITRFVCAFLAIYLPAIYVGIVSFHPGMLPTTLAISIAQLRAATPFPALVEALILEALLEVFQEAVVRLPVKISGAASIVGALVIGTTTVQAGIVNPLLVVIMATAALSSFTMTSINLSLALRVFRVPLLFATAVLGLYGLALGGWILTVHLCAMRSFGESYLGGLFNVRFPSDWKDQLMRLPAKLLRSRSKELGAKDPVRTEGEV